LHQLVKCIPKRDEFIVGAKIPVSDSLYHCHRFLAPHLPNFIPGKLFESLGSWEVRKLELAFSNLNKSGHLACLIILAELG